MSNHSPFPSPPPELVQQWHDECHKVHEPFLVHIANQAAQWGADQELEACCEVLTDKCFVGQATLLREWRRPKPPSLKEQALLALAHLDKGAQPQMDTTEASDTIRRALEALDD